MKHTDEAIKAIIEDINTLKNAGIDVRLNKLADGSYQDTSEMTWAEQVAGDLLNASCYFGLTGLNRLLNREMKGWEDIRQECILYRMAHSICLHARFTYKRAPRIQRVSWHTIRTQIYSSSRGLLPALYALSLYVLGEQEHSDNLLRGHLEYAPDYVFRAFEPYHLRPFSKYLFEVRNDPKALSRAKKAKMGIYSEVFKHWDDQDGFEQAIIKLLDYREESHRIDNPGDCFSGTFRHLPMEFFALKQVRKELDRFFPEINHPALDDRIPEPSMISPGKNPLLSKIVHRFDQLKKDYTSAVVFCGATKDKGIQSGVPDIGMLIFRKDIHGIQSSCAEFGGASVVEMQKDGIEFAKEIAGNLKPSDSLQVEEIHDGTRVELFFDDQRKEVKYTGSGNDSILVVQATLSIIKQHYEVRAFSHTMGSDTQVVLTKPKEWWMRFDSKYPEVMRTLFTRLTSKVLIKM